MKLAYPACFYPWEGKKGGFTVEVPDLPGCVSEGNTLAEAILMARILLPAGSLMSLRMENRLLKQAHWKVLYLIRAAL